MMKARVKMHWFIFGRKTLALKKKFSMITNCDGVFRVIFKIIPKKGLLTLVYSVKQQFQAQRAKSLIRIIVRLLNLPIQSFQFHVIASCPLYWHRPFKKIKKKGDPDFQPGESGKNERKGRISEFMKFKRAFHSNELLATPVLA